MRVGQNNNLLDLNIGLLLMTSLFLIQIHVILYVLSLFLFSLPVHLSYQLV